MTVAAAYALNITFVIPRYGIAAIETPLIRVHTASLKASYERNSLGTSKAAFPHQSRAFGWSCRGELQKAMEWVK
jgi:hypothetical protein